MANVARDGAAAGVLSWLRETLRSGAVVGHPHDNAQARSLRVRSSWTGLLAICAACSIVPLSLLRWVQVAYGVGALMILLATASLVVGAKADKAVRRSPPRNGSQAKALRGDRRVHRGPSVLHVIWGSAFREEGVSLSERSLQLIAQARNRLGMGAGVLLISGSAVIVLGARTAGATVDVVGALVAALALRFFVVTRMLSRRQ